jgi:predicted site-specific integrase-resolvase
MEAAETLDLLGCNRGTLCRLVKEKKIRTQIKEKLQGDGKRYHYNEYDVLRHIRGKKGRDVVYYTTLALKVRKDNHHYDRILEWGRKNNINIGRDDIYLDTRGSNDKLKVIMSRIHRGEVRKLFIEERSFGGDMGAYRYLLRYSGTRLKIIPKEGLNW